MLGVVQNVEFTWNGIVLLQSRCACSLPNFIGLAIFISRPADRGPKQFQGLPATNMAKSKSHSTAFRKVCRRRDASASLRRHIEYRATMDKLVRAKVQSACAEVQQYK